MQSPRIMPTVPFLTRTLRPLNPSPYSSTPTISEPYKLAPKDAARDISISAPGPITLHTCLHNLCEEKDPKLFFSKARGYLSYVREMMNRFSGDSRFTSQNKALQALFTSLEHAIDMIKSDNRKHRERYMKHVVRDARKASQHLTSMYRASTATTRSLLELNAFGSLSRAVGQDLLSDLAYMNPRLTRTDLNLPRPEGPHSFRNSAFYFPMDTLSTNVNDVVMPRPIGPESQYVVDNNNQIQSASYFALVCLLTGKQTVQDHELSDLFMRFFRTFASPSFFFSTLIERYKGEHPTNLSFEQRRVWENNLPLVRIRVANRMLVWLQSYWVPKEDTPVLHDMKRFVRSTLPQGTQMRMDLSKAIRARISIDQNDPSINDAIPPIPLRSVSSISSILSVSTVCADSTPLLQPDPQSPSARREFLNILQTFLSVHQYRALLATHLTTILAHKFRALKPHHFKITELWRLSRSHHPAGGRPGGVGFSSVLGLGVPDALVLVRTNERHAHLLEAAEAVQGVYDFALCLTFCVCHSIIQPEQRELRTERIKFWINIASLCIDLRNFVASRAIIDGITHPAVTRMLLTVQNLTPFDNDVLFSLCRRLGSGATSLRPPIPTSPREFEDYTQYRQELAEDSDLPTFPLLRVLNDDVYFGTQGFPKIDVDRTRSPDELIHLHPYRIMRNAILVLEKSLPKHPLSRNIQEFPDWLERKLQEHYHVQPCDVHHFQDWLHEESQKQERDPPPPYYVGRHGWVDRPIKKFP